MIAIYWMGFSNRSIAREELLWLVFIGRDIGEAIDPAQPFVYNEELEIRIHNSEGNLLQTSLYGDTARDYRIDTKGEKYITNFKTTNS